MKFFSKIFGKLKGIKRDWLIRNSFLMPILLVVFMSISHVVSWYDIGNPISWAVYLSVAIEIFALASVSAASININRASVWFLFGLVTTIQIIGNIFFEFNDINVNGQLFRSWVELVQPMFEDWSTTDHRRFLAVIQGGSLPLMSLTALHYYIKFGDIQKKKTQKLVPAAEVVVESQPEQVIETPEVVTEIAEVPAEQDVVKGNDTIYKANTFE